MPRLTRRFSIIRPQVYTLKEVLSLIAIGSSGDSRAQFYNLVGTTIFSKVHLEHVLPTLRSRINCPQLQQFRRSLQGLVASSEDGGAFSTGVREQVARCDAERALRLAITLHRPL